MMEDNNFQVPKLIKPVRIEISEGAGEQEKERRDTVMAYLENCGNPERPRFMSGTAIGGEPRRTKQGKIVPCLVVQSTDKQLLPTDKIKFLIPYEQVFPIDPMRHIPKTDEETLRIQMTYLYRMTGAPISFIIQKVIKESNPDKWLHVVCNRRKAMAMQREINYFRYQYITEGIYEGNIVSANPRSITVELGGIEKPFSREHVTSRYIADFTSPNTPKEFRVGSTIPIYVSQVRRGENGIMNADFNLIAAERILTKDVRNSLTAGMRTTATVAHVHRHTGHSGAETTHYYAWLANGCPCTIVNVTTSQGNTLPGVGSICTVEIRDILEDNVIVVMRDVIGYAD